ncbi:MAG: hypothetical protein J5780_03320 [Treponema sp.]|nr:hypothetical protein [Treponema sp.]
MHKIHKFIFSVLFLIFAVKLPLSAAESTAAEPYTEDEFPRWAYDVRRTEIITFGSLPFVTIGVTLCYGTYLYMNGTLNSFPNPLDKSSDSFSTDQQLKILGMSLGASCALGAADLIVSLIKHQKQKNKIRRMEENTKKIQIDPYYFTPLYELEEETVPEENPAVNEDGIE